MMDPVSGISPLYFYDDCPSRHVANTEQAEDKLLDDYRAGGIGRGLKKKRRILWDRVVKMVVQWKIADISTEKMTALLSLPR